MVDDRSRAARARASGDAASRSGKRPGVEVVGMLVAGQDQVDAVQVVPRERGPGHPDVRPGGGLVFLGQVLGEIEVDREQAAGAT